MNADQVIARTEQWLRRAVIGLNLCPFAKAVMVKGQIRYAVSAAADEGALLHDLADELNRLVQADAERTDTTLLIHPDALTDFADFNQFLDRADDLLRSLDLEGAVQIASFHPQYQFAGTAMDDIENATNRAPYPTLHLLREASIERAIASTPDAADIYERNMDTLRRLGPAGWAKVIEE